MATDAGEARHLTLIQFEHAAGAAFGYEDEGAGSRIRQMAAPLVIALATLATAAFAAIGYLV